METTIKQWLDESRKRLQAGNFTEADLQRLEVLLTKPRQMVLYLYSKSTNMRSAIASWALYDPTVSYEPTLPSQDTPYDSVIEAVNDGWRIVQFPRAELYQFSDVDNAYLGYEFILEKSTLDL
jgi:hypothetical protein